MTKDEDFAILAILDATGPQVVWLRIGNCSNRELIHWLGPMLPQIVSRLQRGERLIEVI